MIQCQSISRWVAPVTNRSTQTANCKHKWSLENFIKPKSYIVKERQHHSIHSKKRSICKTLHQMKEQNGKAMEKQKFPENDSSLASYSTEKHG